MCRYSELSLMHLFGFFTLELIIHQLFLQVLENIRHFSLEKKKMHA